MKKAFLAAMANDKKILKQFVERMSEAELKRRIKDYWTLYEHLDHLVLTQKMLLERIKTFIREENPVIKPYVPDEKPAVGDAEKTAADLVAEFRRLRDKQIRLVKDAKKDVWEKKGRHDEYVAYTFEILLRHIILHDSYHMSRMEELWIMKEEFIKELK